MSTFVEKIIKESYAKSDLNELFALSSKEKESKALSVEIQKAREEVKKYNPSSLVGQPGGSTPEETNQNMLKIVKARINDAQMYMPTLAKLVPKLFVIKPNSTNAIRVRFKNYDDCIIPSAWFFSAGKNGIIDEGSGERIVTYVDECLANFARENNIK